MDALGTQHDHHDAKPPLQIGLGDLGRKGGRKEGGREGESIKASVTKLDESGSDPNRLTLPRSIKITFVRLSSFHV
jgi:hypothetical protein